MLYFSSLYLIFFLLDSLSPALQENIQFCLTLWIVSSKLYCDPFNCKTLSWSYWIIRGSIAGRGSIGPSSKLSGVPTWNKEKHVINKCNSSLFTRRSWRRRHGTRTRLLLRVEGKNLSLRSSSSSRYHEINKKEVSRTYSIEYSSHKNLTE